MNLGPSHKFISSLAFGALLTATLPLSAQQPVQTATAPPPVYDVVAIHENKSSALGSSTGLRNGTFIATNATVRMILSAAYGIRQDLISGLPGWANSTHFDVNAKISDPDMAALKNLSPEQRRAMMVTFLQDRFHLRAHIETKTLPVYDLVIAKDGSKLKENTGSLQKTMPQDRLLGSQARQHHDQQLPDDRRRHSASHLAANLAFRVQRNVIDKTGLTGKYDFTLKWRPTELEGKADASADDNAPDLFTALQEQLGLKLEPSKGPVDTLVIDHVEMPTEN